MSPARSERYYSSASGGRDRYYERRSSRDGSGDRGSTRSERSDRGERYRDQDRDTRQKISVRNGELRRDVMMKTMFDFF